MERWASMTPDERAEMTELARSIAREAAEDTLRHLMPAIRLIHDPDLAPEVAVRAARAALGEWTEAPARDV